MSTETETNPATPAFKGYYTTFQWSTDKDDRKVVLILANTTHSADNTAQLCCELNHLLHGSQPLPSDALAKAREALEMVENTLEGYAREKNVVFGFMPNIRKALAALTPQEP